MIASVKKGELQVMQNWKAQAPFFVYQNVKDWTAHEFKKPIKSVNEIQQLVEEMAKENSYDLSKPFTFRITGDFDKITTHVVMPRSEEVEGYVEGKNQAVFNYENMQGEILGFYSTEGQGVYTGKNSKIHVHFRSQDMSVMGHLDALKTNENLKLHLPESYQTIFCT